MTFKKAGSPGMTLATVCIAQFMAPFMLTSVGVALPSLGRDLGASAVQLGLVEQLYVLSLAMAMLTFGRLGDIKGQRQMFLPGLVVFTLMTLCLGFTDSVNAVLGLRFLQGLGGAMVLSGSMAMVAAAYPPERRARKIGLVSSFTYAGLSIGPVVGGYVTGHFGWRSVFWLVTPLGAAAAAMCRWGMLPTPGAASGERMDWRGGIVYALSVGLLMLGAAHARETPWGPLGILSGALGLALFLRLEARTASPLLDVGLLFGNRFFTLSCLAAMGNYASTFGVTFLVSLFLQYSKGLSPREAGFVLLLQPLMQVAVSPLAGRWTERFDPGRLASAGMLVSCVGLTALAVSSGPQTPVWLLCAELLVVGAGFGLFITPNSTAIMGSVERRQFGVASGMIGAMRTLGMASSMTVVALIFSVLMGETAITAETLPKFLSSMRVGLLVFAVFSGVGAAISLGRGRARR
jgi:EmrB/QacA subfamily drug resistance transporter